MRSISPFFFFDGQVKRNELIMNEIRGENALDKNKQLTLIEADKTQGISSPESN